MPVVFLNDVALRANDVTACAVNEVHKSARGCIEKQASTADVKNDAQGVVFKSAENSQRQTTLRLRAVRATSFDTRVSTSLTRSVTSFAAKAATSFKKRSRFDCVF
ncbi:MAG: hypothetical protein IJB88_08255 [Clostridia bacterium]|nr:hypothetical protein [Clostridia bacterium]